MDGPGKMGGAEFPGGLLSPRLRLYWPLAFLALCLAAVFFLHDDFGIAWDDPGQAAYGEAVLESFVSGGANDASQECDDAYYYGPAFEVLSALVVQHFPERKYDVRHLLTALAGVLAAAGVLALAGLSGRPWIFILAPLILVMLPRFTGHAFINSKDIPFACGFAWTMFAFAWLFRGRGASWPKILFAGLCLGLTLSIRTGGILALCFLAAMAVWTFIFRRPETPWASLVLKILVMTGLAWGVMIALWPWAQEAPLANPVKSFLMASQFHRTYGVLFRGDLVSSGQLPRYFLPWNLMIMTPPAVLILFAAGLFAGGLRMVRAPRSWEAFLAFSILLWLVFPIFYAVSLRPNIYDGVRHFLFILPALALTAAMGAGALLRLAAPAFRKPAAAGLLLAALLPLGSMAGLHPYEMTYYNAFVGGVGGAWENYDTDYWVTSYREAVQWLNENTAGAGGPVHVAACMGERSKDCLLYEAAPHLRFTFLSAAPEEDVMPPDQHFYLASTRWWAHEGYPGEPVVFAAGRQSAMFSVIKFNN